MLTTWLFTLMFVHTFTPGWTQYREDGRCGPEYPADNGKPAICDDIPPFPTWFELQILVFLI